MRDPAPLVVLILAVIAPAAWAGGPRGEVQLDTAVSPSGAFDSMNMDIASSGFHAYAVWTELAVTPALTQEIYYSRSTDGGKSWNDPVKISADTSIDDDKAEVAANGNLVVVVWLHGSALATQDIRGVVSNDGGVTFGPVQNLSGPLSGDAGDADSLRVKVSGTNIYVLFEDDAANPAGPEDVYVVSSTDSGATFSNPVRVNDTPIGTVDCDDPELDADGNNAYLVWVDKRTGNDRVYFSRSLDAGATWSGSQLLDSGGGAADAGNPSMSVEGTNVYIAWVDDRNNPLVADDVFFVRSTNSGASFSSDVKLGSAASGVDADSPRVSSVGSFVYACWVDDRNGLENDVFFAVSANNGSSFGAEITLDSDGGTVHNVNPRIRSLGDSVFVAYQEETSVLGLDQAWLAVSANNGGAGTFQTHHMSATLGAAGDTDGIQLTVSDYRDVLVAWVDDRSGLNDVFLNGQRFPNLEIVTAGGMIGVELSDAESSENGTLFLAVFSLTGTDNTLLPGGMNMCLTPDFFTFLLVQSWATPLVTDIIADGSASTIPIPIQDPGFAVGLILNPLDASFLATTDPVPFN